MEIRPNILLMAFNISSDGLIKELNQIIALSSEKLKTVKAINGKLQECKKPAREVDIKIKNITVQFPTGIETPFESLKSSVEAILSFSAHQPSDMEMASDNLKAVNEFALEAHLAAEVIKKTTVQRIRSLLIRK